MPRKRQAEESATQPRSTNLKRARSDDAPDHPNAVVEEAQPATDARSSRSRSGRVRVSHGVKKHTASKGRPRDDTVKENGRTARPVDAAVREADVDPRDGENLSSRSYWLMKAEPESRFEKGVDVKFSIDDLREAKSPEPWDGVRNHVAQKNMRLMKKGDFSFFYHSNCKTPGIAGVMEIVGEHSVDESAFDSKHPYFDPKSSREKPKWEVVHVEFRRKFDKLIPLDELKAHAKPGGALENLQTIKQSRLSVSAVTPFQWEFIMKLAERID